jgi:hypothetical protein
VALPQRGVACVPRQLFRTAVALSSVLALACTEEMPQIVLVIDTDLAVPTELDRVRGLWCRLRFYSPWARTSHRL